ncbi:hypothetical protein [Sphingomonas sp.]|uniref:hypothetical protein n=1 Tax=Sphingomonas sp. TaxID=28214 RepID=UPI0025EC6A8E|nr:hypothetical protein [Sphingomonas sp.]
MRWRSDLSAAALTTALAVAALYPAIAQKSPESILPPGFGQPEPPAPPRPAPDGPSKATRDAVPDSALTPPAPDGDAPVVAEAVGDGLGNDMAAVEPVELPEEARRSID